MVQQLAPRPWLQGCGDARVASEAGKEVFGAVGLDHQKLGDARIEACLRRGGVVTGNQDWPVEAGVTHPADEISRLVEQIGLDDHQVEIGVAAPPQGGIGADEEDALQGLSGTEGRGHFHSAVGERIAETAATLEIDRRQ